MNLSFKKINQKINQLLESNLKIKNEKLRNAIVTAIYITAFFTLFGLLPMIFGIYLLLAVNEKIKNNKLKYSLGTVIVLSTLIFGLPFAGATYGIISDDRNKTEPVEQTLKQEQEKPVTDQEPKNPEIKIKENQIQRETQEYQKPKIETKEEISNEEITFQIENRDDGNLEKGQTNILQQGKNGVKEIKYRVTYTDGKETAREKLSEEIAANPINRIVLNGTKVQLVETPAPVFTPSPDPEVSIPNDSICDPNYSGACVPIASDVDCAGGSGNGPSYVKGPVYVIGRDIYQLDRDGNGVACEN